MEKSLVSAGNQTPPVQLAAYRYTDRAILISLNFVEKLYAMIT
jgi:hypothetical protein